MSRFDPSLIQTNKRLSSNLTKTIYPYKEDDDEDKWIIQHISVNGFDIFNHTTQRIALNCDLQCPSLAPIEAYYIQKKDSNTWDIFVKMPRMKTTLQEKIDKCKKTNKYPKEIELLYCLYSLVKCLEYLEEKNLMHGNIKPTNILFDENDSVYLSDGKMLNFQNGEFADIFVRKDDPLFYTEPAISADERANHAIKRDVWSLGVVMLEFSCCDINIKSAYGSAEEKRNMAQCYIEKLQGRYSKDFIEIIAGLLDVNLNKRRTFKETRELIEQKFDYVKEEYNKMKAKSTDSFLQAKTRETRNITKKNDSVALNFLKLKGYIGIVFAIFFCYIIKVYDMQSIVSSLIQPKLGLNNLNTSLEQENIIIYESEFAFKLGDHIQVSDIQDDIYDLESTDSDDDAPNSQLIDVEDQFVLERGLVEIDDNGDRKENNKNESDSTDSQEVSSGQLSVSNAENIIENGAHWKDYFQLTHEAESLEITASRVLEIDDSILNNLVNDLQTMLISEEFQDLKSFTLFLWKCEKITDSGIRLLGNLLPKDSFSLKSLTLGFNSLKLITDEGMKSVALHVLKNQTSLESLALDFFNCPEITDQGILRLSSSINKFQSSLKKLSLIFSRCNQITDKGLGYATLQALISLKDLKFLSISFGRTSISDRGLIQLGSDLAKYGQSLTDLEIKIYGCEHISDRGFKSLSLEIARNLKQLEHLQFSIWETALSAKAQQFAKKHLEFIPDLDIST